MRTGQSRWRLGFVLLLATSQATAADTGRLSGRIEDPQGKPVAQALVTLQCSCLQGARAAQSDGAGDYRFDGLPQGTYTVMVLAGQAEASKVVPLPAGVSERVDFSVNPNQPSD